jgi:arginyl-tRNA synthetase
LIAQWWSIVKRAGDEYKPQYITRYAMELAHAINTYYHHTPILSQDKIVMMNRLVVVDAVLQVMHNCLTLLGIKPLTQM